MHIAENHYNIKKYKKKRKKKVQVMSSIVLECDSSISSLGGIHAYNYVLIIGVGKWCEVGNIVLSG